MTGDAHLAESQMLNTSITSVSSAKLSSSHSSHNNDWDSGSDWDSGEEGDDQVREDIADKV